MNPLLFEIVAIDRIEARLDEARRDYVADQARAFASSQGSRACHESDAAPQPASVRLLALAPRIFDASRFGLARALRGVATRLDPTSVGSVDM
jgi:hypothetical protein